MPIDNSRKAVRRGKREIHHKRKYVLLFMEVTETSKFTLDSKVGIKPLEYAFYRHGLSSSKDYDLRFIWNKLEARNQIKKEDWSIDLQQGDLDMLSHQTQFRLELLCSKEVNKHYEFL